MKKKEIIENTKLLMSELERNYQNLTDCLASLTAGGQSAEYLDAIYQIVREDALELQRLAKLYQKLTKEEETNG